MSQSEGKAWNIHAEKRIADGGGSADAALGFFTAAQNQKGSQNPNDQVVAPIELKGVKSDLDRQKAGESPVDQGWRYANHTEGCKWVIVSNYREVRLYCTRKSTAYYESFFLENLADLEEFKRFYFLLCRQNFLPSLAKTATESRIDRLLKDCDNREKEITDDLYQEYKTIRELLVNDFIRSENTVPNQELLLIEKAQKLLDRVLFIAFCEDQQLLPKDTLKRAHDHQDPYQPRSIWENFKAVFRWVDRGNDDPPKHYESYDGVADLYTYFYEKGLKILRLNGVLSYIVTNKWLRSGYGEPLRRFFSQNSIFEQIIDFGHAPIFQDDDTFPCIVVARNSRPHPPAPSPRAGEGEQEPDLSPSPHLGEGLGVRASPVLICPVPREKLTDINLGQYVEEEGYSVPWSRFTQNAWSLERPEVDRLMDKIRSIGVPLKDFAGVKPYRGIVTGFNEAFLIDEDTKNRLIRGEPNCAEIIKPYLRGQDVKRWASEGQNLWMIVAHKGIDMDKYPVIKSHLEKYRPQLEARAGKQLWWQLQASPAFLHLFGQHKLIYQEIQFHPAYSFDDCGFLTLNKAFIFSQPDLYILAVFNSPLMWWHNWRYLPHMKDDALTPKGELMETLPIAPPTPEIRSQAEPIVSRLIEITKANQAGYREVLDWLRSTFRIEKPGQKLEAFANLSRDEFIEEVRKRLPKGKSKGDRISPASLQEIKGVYNDYALPMQARSIESQRLEHQLSDLVNQAYRLTPEEIELMWKTAPPRMPISR